MLAQLSHAMGLNDVCDWLRPKSRVLARFGVTPPSKDGLSNANMNRSAEFAGRQHDNKCAREVCANISAGETVVFDKTYVDFHHLSDLDHRGVWWVTRAKDNMLFRVVKKHTKGHENIIKDQINALKDRHKGMQLRRIDSWGEVDGEWRVMVFITNNHAWSPRSARDLSRSRWDIEVFFKQVTQNLKLGGFLGHSANAVRWQIYTASIIHMLLRFMTYLSEWGHGFTRLFAVTRSASWDRLTRPPGAL